MPLTGGTRLGPYEILAPIGAGGMGEVYKARDTRLDRIVAVKVAGEDFSERFEREARAVAALNHPHICTLHDVGPNYLVMEYIEGQPLRGPMPLAEALRLAVQIAEALEAAHKKGITHRDLKPANILVTKAGVKLLDFGLARFAATAPAGGETVTLAMTTPGTILGTFQYMSPEQLEAKEADARSDIFAFGAVLYEMLTGRRAFEGKSQASLISAIMTSEPAPLAALQPMTPAALGRVIKKCLAKDPDQRWQSAADLADELKWIAAGGSEVARPAEAGPTRVPWAIGVIAAVVFAVSLFLMFLYLRRAPVEQAATKLSVLPPANAVISSDSAPAISPDGRKLAFVAADASGKTMLWVRPLDSLTAQPLAGTEEARQPFWSPDSRFLGFFSQSKLKKIETSGGPPQTVCDTGVIGNLGGTWSPDGVILLAGNGGNSLSPIEAVSAAGGQPKPVTVLDRSRQQRGHSFPHFLPDGRHFLYLAASAKRENTGVYIGSLDSKDTKRLLSVEAEVRYAPPGYLLFVRDGSLMAQAFDASRAELSGDPFPIAEQVVSDPIFGNGMFSVSGNGVLVYRAGAGSGNSQLTWFDRAGKRLGTVGLPGEYLNPELSPDGKRVAFERRSAQRDRDVWLLELSRGTPTRFTFTPSDEYMPIWSPDGSRIVFASNREGSAGLYQKPSTGAGNEERLLASTFDLTTSSWSSDGRFVLYRSLSAKGYNQAWVLPLYGDRKPFPLLQSEDFNQNMAKLSPDGRWLAYFSNETGRYEVYIQTFPKPSGKWQVTTSGGLHPTWSRDGKELFYLALDQELMSVAVKGDSVPELGSPTPLFQAPLLGGARAIQTYRQQWDVAPDGRFLINVPVGEETGSPITLVQNWTAGLKK
jgi:eukaryotic-like serine/threonine-protein kinase